MTGVEGSSPPAWAAAARAAAAPRHAGPETAGRLAAPPAGPPPARRRRRRRQARCQTCQTALRPPRAQAAAAARVRRRRAGLPQGLRGAAPPADPCLQAGPKHVANFELPNTLTTAQARHRRAAAAALAAQAGRPQSQPQTQQHSTDLSTDSSQHQHQGCPASWRSYALSVPACSGCTCRDAGHQVLHRALGVVEGGSHRAHHLLAVEAHLTDLREPGRGPGQGTGRQRFPCELGGALGKLWATTGCKRIIKSATTHLYAMLDSEMFGYWLHAPG